VKFPQKIEFRRIRATEQYAAHNAEREDFSINDQWPLAQKFDL